jgi:PadR family transcriptional regulator PadR
MKGRHVGEFEELVLLAVCILDGNAYGVTVREELEQQAGRIVTLGAIHATLYRLQDKGLLTSSLGGATEERGGRRRRLFRITNTGLEALRAGREVREKMWSLVPPTLDPRLT